MARMRIDDREIKDADVFKIIVEHFPDIIHSVDCKGNILFTNKKASQILGYSKQVFVNLISNACDAMAETKGGSLSLGISPLKSNGTEYWKCEVSDTGTGIPEKDRDKIFQSFYTTKDRGKGTGLGLSISRGIIENHKGNIAVQSEEGRGTTFSVFLKCLKP